MSDQSEWIAFSKDKVCIKSKSNMHSQLKIKGSHSIYKIVLEKIESIRPPSGITLTQGCLIKYEISLVFFSKNANSFYGRQWTSPLFKEENSNIVLDIPVLFKTNIVDESCIAALELRVCTVDSVSDLIKTKKAFAFTLLPLFKPDSYETVRIYGGSVLSLMYDSDNSHLRHTGSNLLFRSKIVTDFPDLQVLLPPDSFFSYNDTLPGLLHLGFRGCEKRDFRILQSYKLELSSIICGPFDSFDSVVLNHLKDEYQLITEDIKILSIVEKAIRLVCHNGWHIVSSSEKVKIPNSSICNVPNISINDFIPDPCCALIAILEYSCRVRTKVISFVSGYGFCLPYKSNQFHSPELPSALHPFNTLQFCVSFSFENINGVYPRYAYEGTPFYLGGQLKENIASGERQFADLEDQFEYESKREIAPTQQRSEYSRIETKKTEESKLNNLSRVENIIDYRLPDRQRPQQRDQAMETQRQDIETDQEYSTRYSMVKEKSVISPIVSPHKRVRFTKEASNDPEEWGDEDMNLETAITSNPLIAQVIRTRIKPVSLNNDTITNRSKFITNSTTVPNIKHQTISNNSTPNIFSSVLEPQVLSRSAITELNKYNIINSNISVNISLYKNIDLDLELYDPLQKNEVFIQFVAFQTLPSFKLPNSVRISYQFYTFPEKISERMIFKDNSSSLKIFFRDIVYGNETVVLPHSYLVDMTKERNKKSFLNYMKETSLELILWDGDSGILFGKAQIPLANLLRQQKEQISNAAEYVVIREDQK